MLYSSVCWVVRNYSGSGIGGDGWGVGGGCLVLVVMVAYLLW